MSHSIKRDVNPDSMLPPKLQKVRNCSASFLKLSSRRQTISDPIVTSDIVVPTTLLSANMLLWVKE